MPTPPVHITQDFAGCSQLDGDTTGLLIDQLDIALPELGWTIPFTNTATKGVYRQGAGSQYYIRVVDDAAGHLGTQRRAYVEVYSSMSDIDTGTKVMGDVAEACYLVRSSDLNATGVDWRIIGNDKFFYLLTYTNGSQAPGAVFHCIGDAIIDIDTGDTNPFFQRLDENNGNATSSGAGSGYFGAPTSNTAERDPQFAYSRDGMTSPVPGGVVGHASGDGLGFNGSIIPGGSTYDDYPDPSGMLWCTEGRLVEEYVNNAGVFRGRMPGILLPLHDIGKTVSPQPFVDGDVVNAVDIAGVAIDMTCFEIARSLEPYTTSVCGVLLFDMDDGSLWE